jgi:hypothetical protein
MLSFMDILLRNHSLDMMKPELFWNIWVDINASMIENHLHIWKLSSKIYVLLFDQLEKWQPCVSFIEYSGLELKICRRFSCSDFLHICLNVGYVVLLTVAIRIRTFIKGLCSLWSKLKWAGVALLLPASWRDQREGALSALP